MEKKDTTFKRTISQKFISKTNKNFSKYKRTNE